MRPIIEYMIFEFNSMEYSFNSMEYSFNSMEYARRLTSNLVNLAAATIALLLEILSTI